jgi:hypothetical protein
MQREREKQMGNKIAWGIGHALGATVMVFPFIIFLVFLLKKYRLKKGCSGNIPIVKESLKISLLFLAAFFMGLPQYLVGYIIIPITVISVIAYFLF